MRLIWHGTASVEAVCEKGKILFDPFVPLKGSDVDVKLHEFDGFSHIFVTHGHIDHITDLPKIVRRNPDIVIHCTGTPFKTLVKKGVPIRNLELMRYGDLMLVNGFTIRAYHGKHAVLPSVDAKMIGGWAKSPARGNMPYILYQFVTCPENDETVFYQIEADGKTVCLMKYEDGHA